MGSGLMPGASEHDLFSERLQGVRSDVSEIKLTLQAMGLALQKLALIEERQANTAAALDRGFAAIAKVEERLSRIEAAQPMQQESSKWVDRGIVAVVTAACAFAAKKLGLLP